MKYIYKKGRSFPVDPAVAGQALEVIRSKNNGILQAANVVNESRPKEAPLHSVFEWDDSIAAEEHRKLQARQLINSVRVVWQSDRQEIKQVPVYVNLIQSDDHERGYFNITDVMSDANKRAEMARKAWADMIAWKERYKELENAKEFTSIFQAIQQVELQELAS